MYKGEINGYKQVVINQSAQRSFITSTVTSFCLTEKKFLCHTIFQTHFKNTWLSKTTSPEGRRPQMHVSLKNMEFLLILLVSWTLNTQ